MSHLHDLLWAERAGEMPGNAVGGDEAKRCEQHAIQARLLEVLEADRSCLGGRGRGERAGASTIAGSRAGQIRARRPASDCDVQPALSANIVETPATLGIRGGRWR